MLGRSPATFERTLRRIENRVLNEIWAGPRRIRIFVALCIVQAIATATWWLEFAANRPGNIAAYVPATALSMLVLAFGASLLAVRIRRFRWCLSAAFCCGLAAVIGIGTFWWLQTGTTVGLKGLAVADIATIGLCIGWLTLVLTPIERSQPNMRLAVHRF